LPERSPRSGRIQVSLNFSAYPVQASLGVLGRKWALLTLMNIALGRARRFNELLRTTPGMSKRILAMRLSELEKNGFITRAEQRRGLTRWRLASKGADVLPVLLTLIHFASKWRAPSESPQEWAAPWGKTFEVVYHRSGGRAPAAGVPRPTARSVRAP
jgi:DNA-binding HxlR family transcriptional regulator